MVKNSGKGCPNVAQQWTFSFTPCRLACRTPASISVLTPSTDHDPDGRGAVVDAVGFLLLLPFLIIDLVVASVLMSMGMMMLPPVVVSLPFKLIFFVLVDGWSLVAGSLIQSYSS